MREFVFPQQRRSCHFKSKEKSDNKLWRHKIKSDSYVWTDDDGHRIQCEVTAVTVCCMSASSQHNAAVVVMSACIADAPFNLSARINSEKGFFFLFLVLIFTVEENETESLRSSGL